MALKTILTLPQPPRYQVAPPGFFARHDGKKVIETGTLSTVLDTGSQLIAADTQAEVDAEIARLQLAPLPLTPRQNAAAYFLGLPPERQSPFLAVFEFASAVANVADVIAGVQAVSVLDPVAGDDKTEILRLLGGGAPGAS